MQRQYGSHEERGRFPTVFAAIATVALAVVVVLVLVLSYFSSGYTYYGHQGGWGMMGGFMGFPMLIMVPIVIAAIVVIGWVVYRGFGWGGCCGSHWRGHYSHYGSEEERETAMEILRRRYAKGEITKEQFEQMKKDITG
jgi:putative membrane protein